MRAVILMFALLMFQPFTLGASVKDSTDASVIIKCESSRGTGVMFSNEKTTYIWTAHHVIEPAENGKEIQYGWGVPSEGGKKRTEYHKAILLNFSEKHDVALLKCREFHPSKNEWDFRTPEIGTDIYHIGNFFGEFLEDSYTKGCLSFVGRVDGDWERDQTDFATYSGGSGGGVFLRKGGAQIGIVTSHRMQKGNVEFDFVGPKASVKVPCSSITYYVPARTIYKLADEWDMLHACDHRRKEGDACEN